MEQSKPTGPSLSELRARTAARDPLRTDPTRENIKEATRRLMNQSLAVTVKSIATEAGIARGTFYAHFKGLDALVVEMMVEDLGREAFSVRMLVEKYRQRRPVYAKVLHESNSRAVLEAMVTATAEALLANRCQPDGPVDEQLFRLARHTAWGYIGTLDDWLRSQTPADPAELGRFLAGQTPVMLRQEAPG